MAIGGGFGGLGGLGGMGASFPTRYTAPESQAVGYLPDADTWKSEWQKRYDAEAARRGQGARAAGPSKQDFIAQQLRSAAAAPDPTLTWQLEKDIPAFTDYFMGGKGYGSAMGDVAKFGLGDATYNEIMNYKPRAATAGYQPNFSGLNAERDQMTPLFASQTRQQQAYNGMMGNGQENGVIGPEYTAPDFGQVNGDFGQGEMGAQAPAVDMSWSNGVYSPLPGASGVYGASNPTARRWGI